MKTNNLELLFKSKSDRLLDSLFFKYYLTNISDMKITPIVLKQIGVKTDNYYFKNSTDTNLTTWIEIYHDDILRKIYDNIVGVIEYVIGNIYAENIPNVSHIKNENIDDLLSLKDINSSLNHTIVIKHSNEKISDYSISVILETIKNNINIYKTTNQVDDNLFNLIVEQSKLVTNLSIFDIQKQLITDTSNQDNEKMLNMIDLISTKNYQEIMQELNDVDSYVFQNLNDTINDINALGSIEKSTIYNVKDLDDLVYSITEYIKDKKIPNKDDQNTDIDKLLLSLFVLTNRNNF